MIDLKQFEGFTPGPWRSEGCGSIVPNDELRHVHADGSMNSVARTWESYRTEEEFRANTQLIAAAPTLLSELTEAREAIVKLRKIVKGAVLSLARGEDEDKWIDYAIAVSQGKAAMAATAAYETAQDGVPK